MTAPEELVERLERLAKNIDADRYEECWEIKETPTGKDLRAAAALIRELVKQARDRMDFQFKQSQLGVKDMKRIMELEEALKPFAAEAALWDDLPEPPDEDEKLWIGSHANRYMTDEALFSLRDLRRAAKALEAK